MLRSIYTRIAAYNIKRNRNENLKTVIKEKPCQLHYNNAIKKNLQITVSEGVY